MLSFPKFLESNRWFTLKIGYEVHGPDVCEGLSTNMGIYYTICTMPYVMGTLLHMQYAVSYTDSTVYA